MSQQLTFFETAGPAALHAALAVLNDAPEDSDWSMLSVVRGLLVGYHAKWGEFQQDIDITGVEVVKNAPLINPATGCPSRTWSMVGIIDKVAGLTIFDHKTSSQDIGDPSSSYWRQLAISAQPALYELLMLQHGLHPINIVWDVVRKPTIRPKQVTKKLQQILRDEGTYCGYEVVGDRDVTFENEELFSIRVAVECLELPHKYYARRSVPRTSSDLAEFATELWQIGTEMRDERARGTAFKNPSACFNYNTPCEFLSLCAGEDMPTSDRWQKRGTPEDHPGGKDVLSHSRIDCWQTCRRKHFYRYEMGIERVGAERSEALSFGSLWHKAMDAYWQAFEKEKRDGNEQPAQRAVSRDTQTQLAF